VSEVRPAGDVCAEGLRSSLLQLSLAGSRRRRSNEDEWSTWHVDWVQTTCADVLATSHVRRLLTVDAAATESTERRSR